MHTQFKIYENIVIGGVTIVLISGLYFYIHSLKSEIVHLENSLKDNQVELANSKLESIRLKSALSQQNREITLLKADKQNALKTLATWRALPPKVKYKTITKIMEVKSNECKDIKKQLDIIKHRDFHEL